MPWEIEEGAGGCDGYAVVKKSDGKVVGCHPDNESAKRHLRALYANALSARIDAIETFVLTLAVAEFGDHEGHDFHGNQWTGPFMGIKEHEFRDPMSKKLREMMHMKKPKVYVGKKLGKKIAEDVGYILSSAQVELGDTEGHEFHGNQWTGGRGGKSPEEIEGLPGTIAEFITAHPKLPGEESFVWQARIVDGLPPQVKSDLIFATREKYEPVGYIAEGISQWNNDHGLPQLPTDLPETPCDLNQADEIARYFETTPDQSGDPKVAAAYDDFKRQNDEMYDFMTRPESEGGLGVKVDYVHTDNGNPYDSAAEQAADLRDNHHISIEDGLGGNHEGTMTRDEYNEFRAVHDTFGHAGTGVGFDRHGEYETWLAHSSMYTNGGRDAMSTEYHGVNSALWAGDKGTPGTGKSILLPEKWTIPPWEEEGYVAASAGPNLQVIIDALGLDAEWAQKYSEMPWHTKEGLTASVPDRIMSLEAAVLALANLELGDISGHEFHGNQYTARVGDDVKLKREGKDALVGKVIKVERKPSGKLATISWPGFVSVSDGSPKLHTSRHKEDQLIPVTSSALEFGDLPGHNFHGNQYTYEVGYSVDHEAMHKGEYKTTNVKVRAKNEVEANLAAAQMASRHGIPTSTKLISTQLEAKLPGHGGPGTIRPGDVIVDATNLSRDDHPGEFEYLHGATVREAQQGLGVGKLVYTDRHGYSQTDYIRGGRDVIVERPA